MSSLSTYPGSYDTFVPKQNYTTRILADHVNKLQDTAVNIEQELGIGLKGNFNNLNDRISKQIDANGNIINNYTNLSGRTLLPGEVVVLNPIHSLNINTTTTKNDPNVAGVVSIVTAAGALTPVVVRGVAPVKIIAETNPIIIGDWLTTSTYEGFATKADPNAIAILGQSCVNLTVGSSGIYNMIVEVSMYQLPQHTHLDSSNGGLLGYGAVNSTNVLQNDSYIIRDLNVSDNLITTALSVNTDATITGNLNASGNAFIGGNLDIYGTATLGNNPLTDTAVVCGQLIITSTPYISGSTDGVIALGATSSVNNMIQYLSNQQINDFNNTIRTPLLLASNTIVSAITADFITLNDGFDGQINDFNVYVGANGINKNLYNAIQDDDLPASTEYAREQSAVAYLATNQIRLTGDGTIKYHQNKRLQIVNSDNSTANVIVSSSSYSAPYTTITLTTSGSVTPLISKIRFYSASQENLGITDTNNPYNGTLLDHVRDATIHNAAASRLVLEDLTSQSTGSQYVFNVGNVFKESSMSAYETGLKLRPTTDYTVDGTAKTITFSIAPASGAPVLAEYELALQASTFIFNEDLTAQTTGANTTFNTVNKFKPGSLQVYKNGSRQRQGLGYDYTENGYQQFIMTTAPLSGAIMLVDYDSNYSGDSITIGSSSFEIANTLTTGMSGVAGYMVAKLQKIIKVQLGVDNAPTGSSLEIDIKKNGISIFNPGSLPTLTAGQTFSTTTSFLTNQITEGDIMSIDVITVGSTYAGGDSLYINIITQEL